MNRSTEERTGRRHPDLLARDTSVLVVVDMQEPLLRAIHEPDRLTGNVVLLLRAAGILGVPVLATVQNAARLGGVAEVVAAALAADAVPVDKMCFSRLRDDTASAATWTW